MKLFEKESTNENTTLQNQFFRFEIFTKIAPIIFYKPGILIANT